MATYNLTRDGSILFAVAVLAVIGAAAGVVAPLLNGAKAKPHIGFLILAFVVGAMLSETVAFAHYYFTYGYQDPKLSVGVAVSAIEFGVISTVGGIAMLVAAWLNGRITRRSKGRTASGAPLS